MNIENRKDRGTHDALPISTLTNKQYELYGNIVAVRGKQKNQNKNNNVIIRGYILACQCCL